MWTEFSPTACFAATKNTKNVRKKDFIFFVRSIQNTNVNVGFHTERIEKHRQEIREMLLQLPDGFFKDKGGGASFLQAACAKDGELWTGFHTEVEKLCLLGLASKQMRMLTPDAEIWPMLPGGMPYLRVEIEQ